MLQYLNKAEQELKQPTSVRISKKLQILNNNGTRPVDCTVSVGTDVIVVVSELIARHFSNALGII